MAPLHTGVAAEGRQSRQPLCHPPRPHAFLQVLSASDGSFLLNLGVPSDGRTDVPAEGQVRRTNIKLVYV